MVMSNRDSRYPGGKMTAISEFTEDDAAKVYDLGEKMPPFPAIVGKTSPLSNPPAPGSNNGNQAAPADGSTASGEGVSQADLINTKSSEELQKMAENSVSATSGKAKDLSADMNKAVGVKAYEGFKKRMNAKNDEDYAAGKITKQQHKGIKNRWKNIFNVVPEEDFGLFLMDFGLRMMAYSGQGEAFGTSFGLAGQGALGGVQERDRYEQGLAMDRQGLAMDREKMANDEAWRMTQLAMRPPNYIDTMSGMYEAPPGGGALTPVTNEKGEHLIGASSYNRPYSKQAYEEQLKGMVDEDGKRIFSDRDVAYIVAGQQTDIDYAARLRLAANAAIRAGDYGMLVGGKMSSVDWNKLSDAEKQAIADNWIRSQVEAIRGFSLNYGALGQGNASGSFETPEDIQGLYDKYGVGGN